MADVLKTASKAGSQSVELRLATVINYHWKNGSTLLFDGETEPTTKRYKCITSADLYNNQRVLVAKVTGTYVILGILS